MKCVPFSARLREEDAVVRDDADGVALDAREAADERRAVTRLEFVELAAIDDARDDLAHVERRARARRHHAVDFLRIVSRRRAAPRASRRLDAAFRCDDDPAHDARAHGVVVGEMIGNAGDAGVHVGAAELFGGHDFARRRLHERRAGQKDRALVRAR